MTATPPAVLAYENHRRRMMAYGQWEPFVDATPAREHIRFLAAHGIGWRRVAELAGLHKSTVIAVLYRTERIRPETDAAIRSVLPAGGALAEGARVDGTGTRRRIQGLIADGHTQARQAAHLGVTGPNLGRILRGTGSVNAATARAVREMYEAWWNLKPPVGTPAERRSVTRALALAARNGWVPSRAWDDDAMDDPTVTPVQGWKRHQWTPSADIAADVAELEARGYTRTEAFARLGVTRGAGDKAIARAAAAELAGAA